MALGVRAARFAYDRAMTPDAIDPGAIEAFIARWATADGTERANYQLFALDLCELLGVPKPNPANKADGGNAYVFERNVTATFSDGSKASRFIDLYKQGCFVLEAKQSGKKLDSKGHNRTLAQALAQAEQYARSLPAKEGRPPFIAVVDVGRTIDLFAEFSRSGATYTAFPDANSNRITLADLRKPEVQDRLRRLWTDPGSLDPANYSAKVTKKISNKLAALAKSLEESGHDPEAVAGFLSRCLFTMFAEDVELLPTNSFRDLLQQRAEDPLKAMSQTRALWRDMDTGTDYSPAIEARVLRFNGGLFHEADVLPLDKAQLAMLIDAARANWRYVEPAIFGTLLERALSKDERHKLGAHYTPRAYVERLVLPTVIEPLREEWKDVQAAAAMKLQSKGVKARKEAVALLKAFQHRLSMVRVLDPACGSGNFLYVTLDHMKRLEVEVLAELDKLGQASLEAEGLTVSPHQFLGVEINPRAARIAELVLWIGYLQWHYRTFKHLNLPEPVLRDFKNIENRDAVLEYDAVEPVLDSEGGPVTVWDGRTFKPSPVTGEAIPDDGARIPLLRYTHPRQAAWPEAEFIIGNPPFIGNKRMRLALGDGYVEALRSAWSEVPDTSDFVMYWWSHAAALARAGRVQRFGFITTNSISQTFNRQVLESALAPGGKSAGISLVFAIPDHPWVDSADGAAVRISMTVAQAGHDVRGRHESVISEVRGEEGEVDVLLTSQQGVIHSDLSVGARVVGAKKLRANLGVSFMGVILVGGGFVVAADDPIVQKEPGAVKRYLNGRDLVQLPRNVRVIDFYGLTEEEARSAYPMAFQRVIDRVRPERMQVKRESHRREWWLFGEKRPAMRAALSGLSRYIGTTETAKFRTFLFLDGDVLPDQKIRVIADDRAETLGVLSSVVHQIWAAATGARMGVGNDLVYNNTTCFEPFPFPEMGSDVAARIGAKAQAIDDHRKRQQAAFPELTLTSLYNVLEALRSDRPQSSKETIIHDRGLVSVLRELHDELDLAVLEAYGWSDLDPRSADFGGAVLDRLVALNAQRAVEEAAGTVRWLRPELQNPSSGTAMSPVPEQAALAVDAAPASNVAPLTAARQPWPSGMASQFKAVRSILARGGQSASAIAGQFKGKSREREVADILDTLEAMGQIFHVEGDVYALM